MIQPVCQRMRRCVLRKALTAATLAAVDEEKLVKRLGCAMMLMSAPQAAQNTPELEGQLLESVWE